MIPLAFADSPVFNVKDYGAVGDGTTDDTAAFQHALSTACGLVAASPGQSRGVAIYIPGGNYLITDTLRVTTHRVHVFGDGKYASSITFSPPAARVLWNVSNALLPGTIAQGSFRRLGFHGADAQQKICFDCYDLSEYVFQEIIIASSWTGNSGSSRTPSIGFRINARELVTFAQLDVFADRPFHFRKSELQATIGADHYHFTDLYFNALAASESGILIDADCIVTNWTMDGYQAWVGGTYGLHALGSSALNVVLRNVRYEQASVAGGFALNWEAGTHSLLLDNCNLGGVSGPTNGGARIRSTRSITLLNCNYTGTGHSTAVALDVDGTCDDVMLIGTFFQTGSVFRRPGFAELIASPNLGLTPATSFSFFYRSSPSVARTLRLLGVDHDFANIDIARGELVNLSLNGQSSVSALLEIFGYSPVGPIQEGGLVGISASGAVLIAGTPRFAASNQPSKLCVLWNSQQNVQIFNNTDQTLKCTMKVQWRPN